MNEILYLYIYIYIYIYMYATSANDILLFFFLVKVLPTCLLFIFSVTYKINNQNNKKTNS